MPSDTEPSWRKALSLIDIDGLPKHEEYLEGIHNTVTASLEATAKPQPRSKEEMRAAFRLIKRARAFWDGRPLDGGKEGTFFMDPKTVVWPVHPPQRILTAKETIIRFQTRTTPTPSAPPPPGRSCPSIRQQPKTKAEWRDQLEAERLPPLAAYAKESKTESARGSSGKKEELGFREADLANQAYCEPAAEEGEDLPTLLETDDGYDQDEDRSGWEGVEDDPTGGQEELNSELENEQDGPSPVLEYQMQEYGERGDQAHASMAYECYQEMEDHYDDQDGVTPDAAITGYTSCAPDQADELIDDDYQEQPYDDQLENNDPDDKNEAEDDRYSLDDQVEPQNWDLDPDGQRQYQDDGDTVVPEEQFYEGNQEWGMKADRLEESQDFDYTIEPTTDPNEQHYDENGQRQVEYIVDPSEEAQQDFHHIEPILEDNEQIYDEYGENQMEYLDRYPEEVQYDFRDLEPIIKDSDQFHNENAEPLVEYLQESPGEAQQYNHRLEPIMEDNEQIYDENGELQMVYMDPSQEESLEDPHAENLESEEKEQIWRDETPPSVEYVPAGLEHRLAAEQARKESNTTPPVPSRSRKPRGRGRSIPKKAPASLEELLATLPAPIHSPPSALKRKAPSPDPPPAIEWIDDPLLRNPNWFTRCTPSLDPGQPSARVLANFELARDRTLLRALSAADFELVERDSAIQGADLFLSPGTGVIFRPLAHLGKDMTELMKNIDTAVRHFTRVVVIFALVSYGAWDRKDDGSPLEVDQLTDDVARGLSNLRSRVRHYIPGVNGVLGEVELVFAKEGAGKVAKSLRHLHDRDMASAMRGIPDRERYDWMERRWLSEDARQDEEILVARHLVNSFTAQYIIRTFGKLQDFYGQPHARVRDFLEPVLGRAITDRLLEPLPNPQLAPQ